MKRLLSILLTTCLLLLLGCSPAAPDTPDQVETPPAEANAAESLGYKQITPEEAKAMMDRGEADVILDVRTLDEFETGHIAGAVLLPDYEIEDKAETVLPDKNAVILVYCRSGRRSKEASAALAEMGYQNVFEFGGIIDWPYETAMQATCGGA